MVYALHKFKHFLLGNKFVFYVDHMALVYLVNKPQVSGRIIRWLLLFLKYEFTIVYKLGRTHVIVDVLSKLPISSKPLGVPNQIVHASLFSIKAIWMQEVKTYFEMGQMPKTQHLTQKQKLAKKVQPFIMKEGIMYRVGQDNRMHRCLTTSKAHVVLKDMHERVVERHFFANIKGKKILDA
jgi:hypothetical protein